MGVELLDWVVWILYLLVLLVTSVCTPIAMVCLVRIARSLGEMVGHIADLKRELEEMKRKE